MMSTMANYVFRASKSIYNWWYATPTVPQNPAADAASIREPAIPKAEEPAIPKAEASIKEPAMPKAETTATPKQVAVAGNSGPQESETEPHESVAQGAPQSIETQQKPLLHAEEGLLSKEMLPEIPEVQGETVIASRTSDSESKNIPGPLQLEKINEIFTPKEVQVISSQPAAEAPLSEPQILPPKFYDDIILESGNPPSIPASRRLSDPPPVVDAPASIPVSHHLSGPPPVVDGPAIVPINSYLLPQSGNNLGVHNEVIGAPSESTSDEFVAVAAAPQDVTSRILKPAGIVVAGAAGISTLVGVLWLFNRLQRIFKRSPKNPTGRASRYKRRHARAWTPTYDQVSRTPYL
jgi:hypothetical protein